MQFEEGLARRQRRAASAKRDRPGRACLSYERRDEEAEDRAEVPADAEAAQARVRDWNLE
jgi:hypothetical protein